ncbi:MAG: hypothetical protein E7213_06800 [Clostridium sp.]|nr:hypothetical protein [Clostridium sp.]
MLVIYIHFSIYKPILIPIPTTTQANNIRRQFSSYSSIV